MTPLLAEVILQPRKRYQGLNRDFGGLVSGQV